MTWLSLNWPQVLNLAMVHLLLALPAVLISVLVAVPLGRLAHRHPRAGGTALGGASLLYAVPALPMLIIIPALTGLPLRSPATLITALSIYGIALLARTAADAFNAVDPRVHDSAVALGYTRTALLWRVDLPLALPVLLSGVRVLTMSTVSLVTIGAVIGVPTLGTLLTDGFQRGIPGEVATGLAATVALALTLDGLWLVATRAATPWNRSAPRRRQAPAVTP